MSDKSQRRIIIRHVSGSKTNQVEQFPLKKTREITLGRNSSSTIAFDPQRDDVVSRRHAAIRVEGDDTSPVFKLSDCGSSNGTFLNGEPITSEVELAPDDIVELGEGGPKFSFDVQPRPESFASRTRVINPIDATVTRAIAAADADATREVAFSGAEPPAVEPVKAGVGKDTVLRMLTQERKSTSRGWMISLAAVVVVLCLVGYGFYRHSVSIATRELAQQTQKIQKNADAVMAEKLGALGKTAKEIDEKYRNTVVYVDVHWRLFDQGTGKPVYQKVVKTREGNSYPGFIKLPNGSYARWLTLDDGDRTNLTIGDQHTGSGFVVGQQGFLLTNKHVAASWLIPYGDFGEPRYQKGAVYTYGSTKNTLQIVNLASGDFDGLRGWIPDTGAPVFSDEAKYIGGENDNKHTFTGRNEFFEVRFPSNRIGIQAGLVRISTDADVALIKIDAPQTLKAVELASASDQVEVGDRVIAMGYPAVSAKTYVEMATVQGGHMEKVDELIPEPTLTEGLVMRLGSHLHRQGEATVYGTMDDAIQLSINATGAGNSGGPVFNDKGHVIGLFTYKGRDSQGTQVSYAVPIRHGLSLLQPQQAGAD